MSRRLFFGCRGAISFHPGGHEETKHCVASLVDDLAWVDAPRKAGGSLSHGHQVAGLHAGREGEGWVENVMGHLSKALEMDILEATLKSMVNVVRAEPFLAFNAVGLRRIVRSRV